MRRFFIFCLIIIALLGAGLSGAVWLSCSLSGNRYLMQLCTRLTTIHIDATIVRPLLPGLEAEKVQVSWPQGEITLARLALDWQPLALFDKRLRLDLLQIESLDIRLTAPDPTTPKESPTKPAPWNFPELPKLPLVLELSRLELQKMTLQPSDGPNLELTFLNGGGNLKDGRLEINAEFSGNSTSLPGQQFSGNLTGSWQGKRINLGGLELDGRGFHLKGQGDLAQRLELALKISDLGSVLAGSKGTLNLDGWLAYNKQGVSCNLDGAFQNILRQNISARNGKLKLLWPGGPEPGRIELQAEALYRNELNLDKLQLLLTGYPEKHNLTLNSSWENGNSLALEAAGGWQNSLWKGALQHLSGTEKHLGRWHLKSATTLQAGTEKLVIDNFSLAGEKGWQLQGKIAAAPKTACYQADLFWKDFSLALLQPLTRPLQLDGQIKGHLKLESQNPKSLTCDLQIEGNPGFKQEDRHLIFSKATLKTLWHESGLQGEAILMPAFGGTIKALLLSPQPGHPGWPEPCNLELHWRDLPVSRIAAWFRSAEEISGRWQGELTGTWRSWEKPFSISGRSWLEDGKLSWKSQESTLHATLEKAEIELDWPAAGVEAKLDILLAEKGRLNGVLDLPLPARIPLQPLNHLPLAGNLNFAFEELGFASLLFPDMVDEVRGRLKGELNLGGKITQPKISGSFALEKAGGVIPEVGLNLEDLSLQGRINDDRLSLTSLHLKSGGGELNGSGKVELKDWLPIKWDLAIKGEKVLLIDLPEWSLHISPDLKLIGTPETTAVSGTIIVPEMLLTGIASPPRGSSPDVVIVEKNRKKAPPQKKSKLKVNTTITLGDSVIIKAQGLDARLEGNLKISNDDRERYLGEGEINIAQGSYSAYGLRLPISRGRLFFAGGKVEEPLLDILAEQVIGEIKAGILVSGTPRQPKIKLVSTPALADTDILSYIVLGRSFDQAGGQESALMLAANALLARGESAALQEELKRYLGIDVLKVESGAGNIEEAMITVGKYLTPKLYLSFGQSLLSSVNLATLSYRMTEKWELESQFGTISGADIFYKLEFP